MTRFASIITTNISTTGSTFKSRLAKIANSLFFGYYNNPFVFSTKEYTEEELYKVELQQETEIETLEGTFNERNFNLSLRSVPENLRKPFEMHISGYTTNEIAQKLGLRASVVKSRIAYMNKQFENCFC